MEKGNFWILLSLVQLVVTVCAVVALLVVKERYRKGKYALHQAETERDVIKQKYEELLEADKDRQPY